MMAPIGIDMANSRYTAKKSAMAAVALFVALTAAIPVLANTAQEKVVSRLSTTGEACQNPLRKEARQPWMPASLQVSQELEQGTYQERFIRRLSGDPPAGVGRKSLKGEEATQSSLQASQEPEQGTYQERFIRRLAGETLARTRGNK